MVTDMNMSWNMDAVSLGYVGLGAVVLFFAGYVFRKYVLERGRRHAYGSASAIIAEAERDAETKKREAALEARDELHKTRARFEEETRDRRQELMRLERRLEQREQNIDRKVDLLDGKEKDFRDRENGITKREEQFKVRQKELDVLLVEERQKLQRMSGLTKEEATRLLLEQLEKTLREEKAVLLKRIEDETNATAEKKAREIVSLAIQRLASEQVAEATVSVVSLPNDEMKGRIIGREGRNIRAFETATGINLIIDDTPEAVVLSGFDGVRREIARLSLEKLIADGRIHPGRIEEVVNKAKRDMEVSIREDGEKAAFEVGIAGLHPEETSLLGRLKYRTSYGQNVLEHSKEVAHLAGIMAAELGIDQKLAKRTGLLHDIGKAIDHEVEGTHTQIGIDLLRKYGEAEEVIDGVATHHSEPEPKTVLGVLIQAADAMSAARPGARIETWETYARRLEKLEKVADSFPGVEKCFAIQAGREIRVMVKPDQVSDAEAAVLARQIGKKIEDELDYPGQIKVTLIRETRVVDYAK
jgi:ribonuclease Y